MKKFLQKLGHRQEKFALYCDRQSAIHRSKNFMFYSRSNHIYVRHHRILDVLDSKTLQEFLFFEQVCVRFHLRKKITICRIEKRSSRTKNEIVREKKKKNERRFGERN